MQSRDDAERALETTVAEETRSYLRQVLDAVEAAIREGRPDGAQPVLALGVLLGWWDSRVRDTVVASIQEAWQGAFAVTSESGTQVSPRADAMAFHIAAVRDRLSRSAVPEIPEAAFEQVRLNQSAAALGGWGHDRQARDIAERLGWEPDKAYWKQQKADAEAEIDKILDPLGRPGSPARTYAHKNDPDVRFWQGVRAEAVDRIKADEGVWETRARRISRTESTAAWNSGSLAALAAEGRTHKKWLAHVKGRGSDRTRESHREANGQVVPLARPFRVGDSLLMMPGDPSAPPWEVINCRCTVVGADEPNTLVASGFDADQLRVPRGNGDLSGRWMDSPLTIITALKADLGETPVSDRAYDKVLQAEKLAEIVDPRDAQGTSIAEVWDALDEANSRTEDPDSERLITAAMAKVDMLNDIDWSLFDEDTDVGSGESDTDVGAALPEGWTEDGSGGIVNGQGWEIHPDGDDDGLWNIWTPDGGAYNSGLESREEAIAEVEQETGYEETVQRVSTIDTADLDKVIADTRDAINTMMERAQTNGEFDSMDTAMVFEGMTARIQKVFAEKGLTVSPTSYESGYEAAFKWSLMDGPTQVGTLERRMTDDWTVTNEYFHLTPAYQGNGLATNLAAELEGWYAENGVQQIRVHANIDVGGYTWARQGFEIDDSEDGGGARETAIDQILMGLVGNKASEDSVTDDERQLLGLWHAYYGSKVNPYEVDPPSADEDAVRGWIANLQGLGLEFDDDVLDDWLGRVEDDPQGVVEEILAEFRQSPAMDELGDEFDTAAGWAEVVGAAPPEGYGYGSSSLPSMYDLATFGQGTSLQYTETYKEYFPDPAKPPVEHTRTTWPGKQALLGTDWYGVKYLNGGW